MVIDILTKDVDHNIRYIIRVIDSVHILINYLITVNIQLPMFITVLCRALVIIISFITTLDLSSF